MMEQILEILKEFGVEKLVTLSKTDKFTIEKKPGSSQVRSRNQMKSISGTISTSVSEEKLETIMEKFDDQGIQLYFQRKPQIGDSFRTYEIGKVFDNQMTILAHQPGEVLCVNFQSLVYPEVLTSLNSFQELFVHWQNRVRIVEIFVGESRQEILNWLQESKLPGIKQFMFLEESMDSSILREFQAFNTPFIILVNKFGKIDYFGELASLNLEKRINELIEQASQVSMKAQCLPSKYQEYQKYMSAFSVKRVEEHFKDVELFCFQYSGQTSYANGHVQIKGSINATIMRDEAFAEQKVYTFFDKLPNIKLIINKVDYLVVPDAEGAKCWECSKLLQYPFYWLKWEEGIKFGCRKCVEATSNLEGHHFKYEKNSVLLMGKWDKLACKNLGNNLQPIHPKQISNHHTYGCDGRQYGQQGIGHARYICQGCRMDPYYYRRDYIDFCEVCVERAVAGDVKITNQLSHEFHQLNHPLLRVLYNISGYYDF